ncbi:MAG: HIRAN domain-containing protein, partial [Campylobacterota bacterium]|nr:HIRAN domain-containing protein [Campylobacterota bacterium]
MGIFYIAGTQHVSNMSELFPTLKINDTVKLIREKENPYDAKAVKVITGNGEKLGYIPRNFNHFPAFMMDNEEILLGEIRKLQWEQERFSI